MNRRIFVAALTAWLIGGCAERQGTQAVVHIELDPQLLASAASLELTLLETDGGAPHGAHSIPLTGAGAATSPFSFGAVPLSADGLHLKLRALDASGQTLASQLISATLPADKAVPMMVSLSASCVTLTCEVGVTCSLSDDSAWTKPCGAIPPPPICVSYNGGCDPGCVWPGDLDCPAPNGQKCATSENCEKSQCVDGFCCNELCVRDCAACNRSGFEGICTDYTPDSDAQNCGGCNMACDKTNIPFPTCTGATCDGECAAHFDDCDHDKRQNGCETDLRSDPDHCGNCKTKCPYRSCVDGVCKTQAVGFVTGTGEAACSANRMHGVIVFNGKPATLAGLGIRARRGGAAPAFRVRVALYASNMAQGPGQILAQTTELVSDEHLWDQLGIVSTYDGIEQPVAALALRANTFYWLFFIADQTLYLASEKNTDTWRETAEIPYVSLSTMPESPGSVTTTGPSPLGDLYMITTASPP